MAKPKFQPQRDLPLVPQSYWDTVSLVRHALDDLERGYFRGAANLVDAMLRDDRISGVLSARVNGLLGQTVELDAGDDAPKPNQDLADDLQQRWPDMFPEADLEDLLRWGLMLGFGPGELLWDTADGKWVPRLKVWHPSMVFFDWGPRIYRLLTQDGQVDLPDQQNGNWLLFTPYGYQRGWMRAAVRALALPWIIRGWARRDWARHSEVHGSPVKKGISPLGASKDERDAFVAALQQLGGEGVIECPTLPDGRKFDLELVEAQADTWEGFRELLGHADTAIAIVLLGQNLTTEVKQGSRAAAQVHDQVRKDFQQADARKLGRAIQVQVLKPYASFNLGKPELAPFPAWQTEPPEDVNQRATALQAIGGFLTSAKTAGAPVDTRALLDGLGVPLLTPAQEAKQKQEAAEAAAQAQAAFAGEPDDEEEPDDQAEQLSARPRVPPGARKGQRYADRLTEAAAKRGATALTQTLSRLRTAVTLANTPDELKKHLVEIFGELEPKAFEKLVERAHIMAELMGRTAVLQDL